MDLGGRYQLRDFIDRGGMATVHYGIDTHTGKVVAIKILRDIYIANPNFGTRFLHEARIALTLQHPNIVQVYDYGQVEGNYYMVMELVEGTNLRRYLRARGNLDVQRAITIANAVALGLGAAHDSGIVHTNVTTQNILMGRFGAIKLTSFFGMPIGGVKHYVPEQAQGEPLTPAADVYMLGIIMYEMLAGRAPFDGDTPVAIAMQHIHDMPTPPSQFNPNIPQTVEGIIMKCLEKAPDKRYQNGSELARSLENI